MKSIFEIARDAEKFFAYALSVYWAILAFLHFITHAYVRNRKTREELQELRMEFIERTVAAGMILLIVLV